MTVEKNLQNYWVISDMVGNQLVTHRYEGFTKKEAIREFKKEIKKKSKESP